MGIGDDYMPVEVTRNILTIPSKLLLLNPNYSSGNVSPETLEKVQEFLKENDLFNVHVSVNEYDPVYLTKLTLSNREINPFFRCTIGLFVVSYLTLQIPKLLGVPGDHYNPWANNVYLVSNDPSIALHECGHAKDFNSRKFPALYSLSSAIPLVGPFFTLYKEYKANQYVYEYLHEKKDNEGLKKAATTLCPAFATYVGGTAAYVMKRMKKQEKVASRRLFLKTVFWGHVIGHGLAKMYPFPSAGL